MEFGGKKMAAWATSIGILMGVLGFIGIRGGDFFVRVSEGVAIEGRLIKLEERFEDYKQHHDRWASIEIEKFEQQLIDLREDYGRLENKIDKLDDKMERLLAARSGPYYPK